MSYQTRAYDDEHGQPIARTALRIERHPSPEAVRFAIEAQLCPFCGKGPFVIVALHTNHAHGIDRRELRDLAGIYYSASITPPEHRAERAEAARKYLVPIEHERRTKKGSKDHISTAGRAARYRFTEDDRSKSAKAMSTDEVREKLRAAKPPRHGTRKRYEKGCRCAACKARNAQRGRDQRARRIAAGWINPTTNQLITAKGVDR